MSSELLCIHIVGMGTLDLHELTEDVFKMAFVSCYVFTL